MIRSKWTPALCLSIACLWASAAAAKPPVRLPVNILSSAVRDANGVRPLPCTDPTTPLFSTALAKPLLAPDGHQLTWGEWMRPQLEGPTFASVRCVKEGTEVYFRFSGLIPNALYSVWLFIQRTASSPIESGKLPTLNGQSNGFNTDANGAATFRAIAPPGPLSISGSVSGCLFELENFSLNLTYHSDGHLYGDVPGPAGITLQQFNFAF